MTTPTIQITANNTSPLHDEKRSNEEELRRKREEHLNAASKYYLEAEKYKEAGDKEKAAQSTLRSKEELHLASLALKEEVYFYNSLV